MKEKKETKQQKKSHKGLIFKLAILALILVAGEIITDIVQPLITTHISIKAQLEDSYESYGAYRTYLHLLQYRPVLYILIIIILFWKELKTILGGNENEKD